MTGTVLLATVIGGVSLYGAAYLLALWHEDRAAGTNGWPLSRVVAYLAVVGTIGSNYLAGLTYIRLLDVPNWQAIQVALTPLTFAFIVALILLFPALALYLRAVRATGYMTPSERAGLATEASVQEVIALTKAATAKVAEALDVANHSNEKLIRLTEIVGGKEDKDPATAGDTGA